MPDHAGNQSTQKRGLEYLSRTLSGFHVPSSREKDRLLELLGISRAFKQTFDAIVLKVPSCSDIQSARDFDLIEIKTTDECLPRLPEGFFFGMTENQEMLLKVFEGKYFLCFVCVHKNSTGHKLVGWTELQSLIHNKRVQYQINLLRSKAASISK